MMANAIWTSRVIWILARAPNRLGDHFGDKSAIGIGGQVLQTKHTSPFDWVGNHILKPILMQKNIRNGLPIIICDEMTIGITPETAVCPCIPTFPITVQNQLVRWLRTPLFAKEYDLDGRVDAVKHIPYAVHRNFQTQIAKRIENENFDFTQLVRHFQEMQDC